MGQETAGRREIEGLTLMCVRQCTTTRACERGNRWLKPVGNP